ncbi:MAG: hypothetical protein ACRECJ_00250, partial [Limisphaerales bacterium]
GSQPNFGFLDTKRGRVWFYSYGDSAGTWFYHDLTADARVEAALRGLRTFRREWEKSKEGLLEELGDTAKVRAEYERMRKFYDEVTEREVQQIREQEK